MMTNPVPTGLQTPLNRQVIEYLDLLSAHSDVGEALLNAVKPLGDVQLYCPNWHQCRYVVASTSGVVIALAVGMNTIGFRLDERMKMRALASGATSFPECGSDWVSFTLFRDDWPQVDLAFWARKAYAAARASA